MTENLTPNSVVSAVALDLRSDPHEPGAVVSGAPDASLADLFTTSTAGVGVWQIEPGVVTATEADELFVVLEGAAVVEFEDDDRILRLSRGSVGRFAAGSRTRWTVTETLKKVYVVFVPAAGLGDAQRDEDSHS